MQADVRYEEVVGDVYRFLDRRIMEAVAAGISEDRLIVDPGIGFGKGIGHNLEIIGRLRELRCLGLPILVGASRKAFIGQIAGGAPGERLEGSLAMAVACIMNGASIVRVHDVRETVRVARMIDAMMSGRAQEIASGTG